MMTIHKLSAGDGYLYYTRETATGDELRSGHRELSGFYSSDGTPPGVWVGSGCVELGVEGDVTEAQIRALYGEGLHPDADRIIEQATAGGASATEAVRRTRLGRRYYRYEQTEGPLTARVQDSIQRHEVRKGRAATGTERERLRNAIGAVAFREDFGRAPGDGEELRRYVRARTVCRRQAVAGYDLVFRNKHASVLWALTDEETGLQVQAAHEQAIAETLNWIEENALATRTGRDGIAQEDVRGGLVAAQYRHYDSRRGDPLLHDHVVVANKVLGLDGRWRSIDGKLLYAMSVTASELYNQRVLEELCRRLDVRAEARVVTPGKRPVMAISGIDDDLVDAFSKRAQDIRTDLPKLLEQYRRRYGREPDTGARMVLIQQAAQQSRPRKKKARALRDLRAEWRAEAVARFGPARIDGLLERARRAAVALPEQRSAVAVEIEEAAGEVVRVVSAERSVWARRHVLAEARRQVVRLTNGRGAISGLAERVAQHVLEYRCLELTLSHPHRPFAPLARADGSSVYRRRESRLYTSKEVLSAEARIVNAARTSVIPALGADRFAALVERHEGHALSEGELRLAEEFACSDRLLAVGVGSAGSGKSAVLRLVRDAVTASGGRLVPLAPFSRAAEVMEGDLDIPAHTLNGWLAQRDRLAAGRRVKEAFVLRPGDVIVVDEAGRAGTQRLARIVSEAESAGALVRLFSAPAQLGAVESGSALRLVAREGCAVELESPPRFRGPDEAEAALALRGGPPADAWHWYLDQGRVVGGDLEEMLASIFSSWRSDTEAGRLAVMVADDMDSVRSLNARAQAFHITSNHLDLTRSSPLRDGLRAAVGDLVITRKTERRLPVNAGCDFVKNGDQWRVEHLDPKGNATVRHTGHGGRVVLSAAYLRRHGELGYATTVRHVQGLTADTSHGLITARTSRESAYVMATRGRHSNHLHIAVDEGQSLLEVLDAVARTSRASLSAHEAIRSEQDHAYDTGQLAAEYADVHARAVSHRVRGVARRVLGSAAEEVLGADAWSRVERSLRDAEADGWNAGRLLASAHTEHGFADADDRAAVLSSRINTRIAEGRTLLQRATERETRQGNGRPLKHLDAHLLARLLERAECQRRDILDELHRADPTVADQPSPVVVRGLPHPAWPHRAHGHLTRLEIATAIANARSRVRRGDATPAVDHAELRREQRLRHAMRPLDRMREDWQREPIRSASYTARSVLTGNRHHQQEACERLHRGQLITDRICAELRLRDRLPQGPASLPDHSGPLPDWLAPSAALRDLDTPAAWRQHLAERRSVISERLAHNGALLAARPPTWARALGPVPKEQHELRTLWERTAALAEAWRTRHGLDDATLAIGDQPKDPIDAPAWATLHQRIADVGRRTRKWAAARAHHHDDPTTGMRVAARAAEAISTRVLQTHFRLASDREAVSTASRTFADIAMRLVLRGEDPPEPWVRHIPAPDTDDVEQQGHWRQLVTALATWRLLHLVDSNDPLGEGQTPLHPALDLFQRSRIHQRLARINPSRAMEDTGSVPSPNESQTQRQQRLEATQYRRGPTR